MDDLISRSKLIDEIKKAQKSLESSEDKTWEMNKKYYKGLAWALRLILDAPAVKTKKD